MDQDLIDYITKILALADLRNLSEDRAVVFRIDIGNGDNILVVASYYEPDYRQYPFNVIWIPANPSSGDYAKALRRTDKVPAGGYNDTWDELTTFASLTDEMQYFDNSNDNTFLLGELGLHGQVLPAAINRLGSVKLNLTPGDANNPVVVSSNDPRMTNDRDPLPHTHPEEPYTHLVGSTTIASSVTVNTSNVPSAGQVLKITGNIGGDATQLVGEWVDLTQADINYTGPSFDSLTITGPATVEEGNTAQFQATANFSDSSTETVPATWSITAGASAGSIDANGLFTANQVTGDVSVTIQAEYLHAASGVTQTDTHTFDVTDQTVAVTVTSIAISGPTSVDQENTANYQVTATYSDTSTAIVTPDTWSVPAGLGTINASGQLTAADVTGDQTGDVHAEYDPGDGSGNHTADLSITVNDTDKTPVSLAITGPTEVDEGTQETFIATVTYDDTSTAQVVATWSNTTAGSGSIDSGTGVYTANLVTQDESDGINASYTENSTTVNAPEYAITVKEVPVVMTGIVISGATSIQEGNSAAYTVQATYSDSSTADVTGSVTWSIPTGSAYASFAGATLTANMVTGDQSVQIQASIDPGDGSGTHTDTHDITVTDSPVYPLYGFGPANASADSAFIDANITNEITGSSPQVLALTGPNSTDYGWIAFPESMITTGSGDVEIYNIDTSFQETWGGAGHAGDFPFGGNTDPLTVSHNGQNWKLYRTDYAFGTGTVNYQFTWTS